MIFKVHHGRGAVELIGIAIQISCCISYLQGRNPTTRREATVVRTPLRLCLVILERPGHGIVMKLTFIGTLRGVGGRGVGDYTSLNRPY